MNVFIKWHDNLRLWRDFSLDQSGEQSENGDMLCGISL